MDNEISIYQLNNIKALDIKSLGFFLDAISKKYSVYSDLVKALNRIIVRNGFQSIKDEGNVIFVFILALVLSDIGSQLSPVIRRRNTKKIEKICKDRFINYEMIRRFTEYEPEIISAFIKYEK